MKNGPYILVLAPIEYPGKKHRDRYVYEHHLIWWKNTLFPLSNGYIIHHRNGVKTDNKFENLEMIYKSTHPKIHKNRKNYCVCVCSYCNKPFIREPRNYNFKKLNGQKNFFCCKKH